jgi:hypothetical protein
MFRLFYLADMCGNLQLRAVLASKFQNITVSRDLLAK